jgi:AcrR family transcriptional regulator
MARKRQARTRRGPRFTAETHDETARRLQVAAVEIASREGVEALSIAAVASAPGLDVSRTAPLHYFGTTAGMLAAVAEHGFMELAARLRTAGPSPRDTAEAVKRAALVYAEYALRHARLWRTMHSARLWQSIAEKGLRHGQRSDRAIEKAQAWMDRADAARLDAFAAIVQLISEGQKRPPGSTRAADLIAHAVTALVDGFMFQIVEEQVGAGSTEREKLDYFERLLDLAVGGLGSAPAATRSAG